MRMRMRGASSGAEGSVRVDKGGGGRREERAGRKGLDYCLPQTKPNMALNHAYEHPPGPGGSGKIYHLCTGALRAVNGGAVSAVGGMVWV